MLTTGETVSCVSSLLHDQRKEVLGLITGVELKVLKVRSKLNFPVDSMITLKKNNDVVIKLIKIINKF